MKNESIKVSIVERNKSESQLLKKYLVDLGYNVLNIDNDGRSALENFNINSPDLLLVDLELEGEISGVDLVVKIKEKKDFPIIYLCLDVVQNMLTEAEKTYPCAFLYKPISQQELASAVKLSLARYNKQRELVKKLTDKASNLEIGIQELTETNTHLIAATWRERELKDELAKSKDLIEIQTKKVADSINYAQRIQTSIAPSEEEMNKKLRDHFLFYLPKDVVSGDFPWLHSEENYTYFAAVDCTGHGVPGAMMSMIGNLLLNDFVKPNSSVKTPSEVLSLLHKGVVSTLKQDAIDNKASDGMDIALCRLSNDRKELIFSGAHLPLLLLRDNELVTYKGDRFPVGGMQYKNRNVYTDINIEIQPGDKIFIFSDGIIDQLGGEANKKWKSSGLKQFILDNSHLEIEEFGESIKRFFQEFMGMNKQIDDVILFGVKI